ncbi:MAG: ABC transporter permease [Gemmatimonadetes bacterium]|nr:MAG: ABC transporter permease [Gemmatimonadota bacterium]
MGGEVMDTLLQDFRYALRTLAKSPGFTAVVVLTLALGIGANTAIFSVVNGVLLTSLPYKDPSRLVVVWESKGTASHNVVNPANYMDWHDRATSFSGLALLSWTGITFTGDQVEEVQGRSVTPDFFGVVGATPLLGRTFNAEESRPNSPRVIVLSEALWRRRFGADRAIVERAVPVAGGTARVVGVMPASFRPMPLGHEQYWEPMRLDWSNRAFTGRYAMALGRLKDGVTVERAQTEMSRIARQLESDNPDFDTGWGATVVPLMEQVVGGSRRTILIVLGAVSLVLLIACANVANLMLARAASRERELAVRAALGAPRWRLVRQALVESVMLALAGGAAGVLLASWGVHLLVRAAPPEVPRIADIRLDLTVLAVTALVSMAAGVLFGLPAALSRSDAAIQDLHAATTRTTAGVPAVRLRGALVIAQMSLAIVLLVGAGLLVRSLRRLIAVDPGFDPVNLSAVTITLPPPAYPDSLRRVAFYERLLERVRTMPGVQSAGIISWLPMTPGNASTTLTVVGRPEPAPGQASAAAIRLVDPGYFAAMRIPLKRGRSLAPSDRIGSAPVAVISEAMARKLWPGEDPIGQHVKVEWWHPTASVEIVGVVADSRHDGLDAEFAPTLFYPFAQESRQIRMSLVLRSTLPPATLTRMVRAAVSEMDKDVPVADAVTMYHHIAEMMADRRYPAFVLGLFAALALALAAVGIYGVLSYTVGQRTREIGVRVALGARPADVLRTVLGGGLRLTLSGVALGGVAAGLAAGALGKLLYGVHPLDPVTFVIVPLVLVAVALLAMAAPARRAARVDPMVALRSE